MNRSFYHYLMTLRGPDLANPVTEFANHAFRDLQFPKQSEEYQEITNYLELNVSYLKNMDIFDEIWELYQENN